MKKPFIAVPLAALVAVGLVACDDGPSGLHGDAELVTDVVLTQGVPAPAKPFNLPIGLSDLEVNDVSVGGSIANPVSLKPQTCETGSSQEITITYHITGRQDNPASFDIYTSWFYDGTKFDSTHVDVATIVVPARDPGDPATVREVDITVANASNVDVGTGSFVITPANVVTTSPRALDVKDGDVDIHVAFVECPVTNTPPTLTLPRDRTVEATSSAGVLLNLRVTANDAEDGDLTSSVICAPASGSTFPLGETTVYCSVTDLGGLTTQGSFKVNVRDTTAPEFHVFPNPVDTLVATGLGGAELKLVGRFAVAARDRGPRNYVDDVSPPVSVLCKIGDDEVDETDGYLIPIGHTKTVVCTATDSSEHPEANTRQKSFQVYVGLDVSSTCGFGAPLRNEPQYSAHKRNSAVPHKICPPSYAGGGLATDLAAGLALRMVRVAGDGTGLDSADDPAAGSTEWRYDASAGHYVFNAKTANNWATGTWKTTVSYAGIELAETFFVLSR